MKICFLADAASVHTQRWTSYFVNRGNEVHVISFRSAQIPGAQVHSMRGMRFLGKARYLTSLAGIRRLVRRLRPDIVHAHHATSYGLAGAISGWQPLIIHTWGRDILDLPKNKIYAFLVGFNLRRAQAITCTSQALVSAARGFVSPNKAVHHIPFGVDLERFKPRALGSSDRKVRTVGIVKSLEPVYGIDVLIKAFAKLQPQNNRLHLLIVGDGSQRSALETMAENLNIAEFVTFAGSVAHKDVPEALHQIDIFVMPSLVESFGVAAVEAAAAGLPVVASNTGGIPEVVIDGVTGLLVEPGDVDAFVVSMEKLIFDKVFREKLGQAGRDYVIERYDWSRNTKSMEDLYHSLLKR